MVAMGDQKQKFSHETELEVDALEGLLENLLAGVRSGELALEHGQRSLTLRPHGPIAVAIEARHKPGRELLRLELEWKPETVEPVLRVGPARQPTPIEARRRAVVALREARRGEGDADQDSDAAPQAPVEGPLDADALAQLPKERLYALAQTVELPGRSQLHKTALARALAKHDLRPHLQAEDLEVLRAYWQS